MSAYSYYSQEYFANAIGELERFLETYPSHERVSYAYYLLGICYYDQIVDEKRDLKVIEDAKKNNYNAASAKDFETALKVMSSREKKIIVCFGSLYSAGYILSKN